MVQSRSFIARSALVFSALMLAASACTGGDQGFGRSNGEVVVIWRDAAGNRITNRDEGLRVHHPLRVVEGEVVVDLHLMLLAILSEDVDGVWLDRHHLASDDGSGRGHVTDSLLE